MKILLALFLQTAAEERRFEDRSRSPDPEVRRRAVEQIARRRSPKVARLLAPLLSDPDPGVRDRAIAALSTMPPRETREILEERLCSYRRGREGALEALGRLRDPSALPRLREFLADPEPSVRATAARAIGWLGHTDGVPWLRTFFEQAGSREERLAALEGLADLDPRAAVDPAKRLLAERDDLLRLAAFEWLALRAPEEERMPACQRALQDANWRIAAVGVAAARRLRRRELVEALIRLLESPAARMRWESERALRELTGRCYGTETALWRKWLSSAEQGRPPPEEPRQVERPRFFGIPVESRRILFLLDFSSPMADPELPGRGTPADEGRRQFLRVLDRLPPETRLNVVVLGTEPRSGPNPLHTLGKGLRPLTETNRAAFEDLVQRQTPSGRLNLYDPLVEGMEDPEVDTIFLYSAGEVRAGLFTRVDDILRYVREANRFRRIAIHSVQPRTEQTRPAQVELLAGLAADSGGEHVLVPWRGEDAQGNR